MNTKTYKTSNTFSLNTLPLTFKGIAEHIKLAIDGSENDFFIYLKKLFPNYRGPINFDCVDYQDYSKYIESIIEVCIHRLLELLSSYHDVFDGLDISLESYNNINKEVVLNISLDVDCMSEMTNPLRHDSDFYAQFYQLVDSCYEVDAKTLIDDFEIATMAIKSNVAISSIDDLFIKDFILYYVDFLLGSVLCVDSDFFIDDEMITKAIYNPPMVICDSDTYFDMLASSEKYEQINVIEEMVYI